MDTLRQPKDAKSNGSVRKAKLESDPRDTVFEDILRMARPRLIIRAQEKKDETCVLASKPFISEVDFGWDELISAGYDARNSPLGPVYWRIVTRAGEKLYLSTFFAEPEKVVEVWGEKGLAYRDPSTGMMAACMETLLPGN